MGSLKGEKLMVIGGLSSETEVTEITEAGSGTRIARPTVDIDKIPDARKQKLIDIGPSFAEKFDCKYGVGAAEAVLAEHREREKNKLEAQLSGILVAPRRSSLTLTQTPKCTRTVILTPALTQTIGPNLNPSLNHKFQP